MAKELKKDEKPKVKIKLDVKTLHKTLLADDKFLNKLDPKRKECVQAVKAKKDDEDVKAAEGKPKEIKK